MTKSDCISHDVFISYGETDKLIATELREHLEARGYTCWMAPESVKPDRPWAEQISEAIKGCRVVIILVSTEANNSEHVSREVNLAVSKAKPIIPVRVEDVFPAGALEYLLCLKQWIDIFPGPVAKHVDRLRLALDELLTGADPEALRRAQVRVSFKGKLVRLAKNVSYKALVIVIAVIGAFFLLFYVTPRLLVSPLGEKLGIFIEDGTTTAESFSGISATVKIRDKTLYKGEPLTITYKVRNDSDRTISPDSTSIDVVAAPLGSAQGIVLGEVDETIEPGETIEHRVSNSISTEIEGKQQVKVRIGRRLPNGSLENVKVLAKAEYEVKF